MTAHVAPDIEISNQQRSLFIFHDRVAENFVGFIQINRHPAPVVRDFHSLLADKQTSLGQHPNDFNVVHIGFIDDDGTITPIAPLIIATGASWVALQQQQQEG